MKNIISYTLIAATFFISNVAYSQLHFGISPGIQMNGAVFGYKFKKLVPYIGLQVMSGSVNFTETGKRYDNNANAIVDYEDKFKASGTIYMPSLGLKYFFVETKKLKAYGNICLTKFILSAKVDDSNNPTANDDLKKALKNTKISGGQLGFGTEYFFDDNFSLGGEFGFRIVQFKFKEDFDDEVYDPNTGNFTSSTTTNTLKLNFNPTYTKFSLNFYFGGE